MLQWTVDHYTDLLTGTDCENTRKSLTPVARQRSPSAELDSHCFLLAKYLRQSPFTVDERLDMGCGCSTQYDTSKEWDRGEWDEEGVKGFCGWEG